MHNDPVVAVLLKDLEMRVQSKSSLLVSQQTWLPQSKKLSIAWPESSSYQATSYAYVQQTMGNWLAEVIQVVVAYTYSL